MTWPLALALACCVVANVGLRVPARACGRASSSTRASSSSSWASASEPPPDAENLMPRVGSFERTTSWNRWDDGAARGAAPDPLPAPPPRGGPETTTPRVDVGRHPPWDEAVEGWEAAGVDHSYDVWARDYPHPLLRTRTLVRSTSVLSSTTASAAARVLRALERAAQRGDAAPDGVEDG